MAVPYRILVVLHLVVVMPGTPQSQYTTLKRQDLTMKVFDERNISQVPFCTLKEGRPNYYRYLQFLDESHIYIGAMNCLLKLLAEDLSYKDSKKFDVNSDDNWRCTVQGQDDIPDCQNHVRSVMRAVDDDQKLFVCSTSSFSPKSIYLHSTNFSDSSALSDGAKMCPFDPLDNATSIRIDQGNPANKPAYYFGAFGDFLKAKPVIYRPSYSSNGTSYAELLPPKSDVTWLNAPQFVGSFDINSDTFGNQVFFFFREIAEEYTPSKTKIYSRVAKVCKNDLGGGSLEGDRKKKWQSYQKARLNCSSPGYEPFYYDDIYDVYESGDNFYALFYRTGPSRENSDDLSSSAICVYSKQEIFNVFRGKFKHVDANRNWVTLQDDPNPRLDDCWTHDNQPERVANQVSQYQLMDTNVDPIQGEPIFYKTGIQFLKLVVINDTDGSGSNIYVATDTGKIYNLFVYNCSDASLIVHINTIMEPLEKPHPIWSMKYLKDLDSLYLGTDYSVTKLSVAGKDVCKQYRMKDTCIHDINCYWCHDHCNYSQSKSGGCITYKDVYQSAADNCKDFDVLTNLNETVTSQPLRAIRGLYVTLNIDFKLQRSGSVTWEKGNTEIVFAENNRLFLANDGSLIISNVTISDEGNYIAFDRVYRAKTKVAEYDLRYSNGTHDELIEMWKQEFVIWAERFHDWDSCAKPYLDQCESSSSPSSP